MPFDQHTVPTCAGPGRPRAFRLAYLLLLVLIAPPSAVLAGWEDYYEDAVNRYRAKEYNAAIIQLKNALKERPGLLPAKILLGRAYMAVGNDQAAELELRSARQQGADPNNVAVALAQVYLAQRKFKELEEEAHRPGYSDKVRSKLLTVLGVAYAKQNERDKAEQAYVEASVLQPAAAEPILARAAMYFNDSELDEASRLVEQVQALAPDDPEAWKLGADIARQRGDLHGALEAYEHTLRLSPDHVPARLGRLTTLLMMGRADVVLQDVQPIRDAHAFNPEAEYLYAEALYRSGETEQARAVVRAAEDRINTVSQKLVSRSPSLTMLSALLALDEGKYDKVRRQALKVLEAYPSHIGARMVLAQVYYRQGRPKEALDYLSLLAPQMRGNPQYQVLYGRVLLQAKRYAEAEPVLEQALKGAKDKAPVRVDLALCRLERGNLEGALPLLEEAHRAGDRRGALLLADTLMKARRLDQARQVLLDLTRHDPDDEEALNLLGVLYVARREFDEAQAAFGRARAIAEDPTAAEINLATLSLQRARPDRAREYYQAILKRDAGNQMALAGLARLAEREGDIQGAIALLEKLRSYHPKTKEETLHLIDLLARHGNQAQAKVVAQGLLDVYPDDFDVNLAMGGIDLSRGQFDLAKQRFRRITRLGSYDAQRLVRLARLQLRASDLVGARWSLEKAVSAEHVYLPAFVELVNLLSSGGETEKALEVVDRLQGAMPESAIVYALRGDIFMNAGHYRDGLEAYQQAFRIRPNPELLNKRYQARKRLGQGREAVRELEAWVQAHPQELRGREALANAYHDVGHLKQAIALTEQLVEEHPKRARLYNNLAWLYHQAGDGRALALAERAQGLSPEDPSVLDTYGWLLVAAGRIEEGLGMLRKAASRQATNPTILYHLAEVLDQAGRPQEALEKVRDALDLKRPFADELAARRLVERLERPAAAERSVGSNRPARSRVRSADTEKHPN